MFYQKDTQWFLIELNSLNDNILVRQNWKYDWKNSLGTSPWTYKEKKEYHHKLDNLLWGNWGAHFKLKVRGTSDFAKANRNTFFSIYFDIKWSLSATTHWTVEVTKIPPGQFSTSSVSWSTRIMNFDSEDVNPVTRTDNGKNYVQYPILHEIGHGMGNSIYAFSGQHGDEYKNTSSFFSDKSSLMNIGNELRNRHIDYLIRELNNTPPLISNTEFYV